MIPCVLGKCMGEAKVGEFLGETPVAVDFCSGRNPPRSTDSKYGGGLELPAIQRLGGSLSIFHGAEESIWTNCKNSLKNTWLLAENAAPK